MDSDSQAEEHDLNKCLVGVSLDNFDDTEDEVSTRMYVY